MDDLPVPIEPDPQTRRKKIHCKQELIVTSLQRFYSAYQDKKEIIGLLDGSSDISLRLVDWFVTNYAKQNNISYILNGQEFLVYTNYKSQLKAYSKKLFDPFCRRERIMFQLAGSPPFMTTVGKLNFFRWALEKGVLNYITLNDAKIEAAMNMNTRDQQKARKDVPRSNTRKRVAQTAPPNAKLMQKHEYSVEVRFD